MSSRSVTSLEMAPLWRLAFRAGFLFAAIFAVLAVSRWLVWLLYPTSWDSVLSPHWWHAHEMIFGFAMPVVGGFLLSAVATWTGLPGTSGTPLKVLFGLWFVARVILWLLPSAMLMAWAAEMLFVLLLMFELGRRVWLKRQWRNLLFLPVLLALAALSSASYYAAENAALSTRLHYGALWMITVLVTIVGGRVIPLFTGNRLGLKIAPLPGWMEYSVVGSVAIIGLLTAIWPTAQLKPGLQILCGLSFFLNLYRMRHWAGWKTTAVPLLWSMHLSYLCIPLSLLGLAVAGESPLLIRNIMHLLAIGTVGGMILSMMSRVSLAHTGRPLEVPGGLAWAFILVFFSAVLRALVPAFAPAHALLAWELSAVLWIIAFAIFVYRYLPILGKPRVDGKPG